ncbi:hypothetical protein T01_3292, partial [Trichinella spiralis]
RAKGSKIRSTIGKSSRSRKTVNPESNVSLHKNLKRVQLFIYFCLLNLLNCSTVIKNAFFS